MKYDAEAHRYYESTLEDAGGLLELRAINAKRSPKWAWFNDVDLMLDQARQWAGEGTILCTTMNQPAFHSPICYPIEERHQLIEALGNPVKWYPQYSLSDDKVMGYKRLLFDFDRKQSNKRNATDEELADAVDMRDLFVELMTLTGWPQPALAVSGNGAHAIYRAHLSTEPAQVEKIRQLYRGLGERFQSSTIKLDTTTRNPAQVCRLYGALNRKYPPTADTQQRVATISLPGDWGRTVVTRNHIDTAAEPYRVVEKPIVRPSVTYIGRAADWQTLDIVSWFKSAGLYLKPLASGKHSVVCPWQRQGHHEKTSYSDSVIWERGSAGYPTFFCSHDTCQGRGSIRDLSEVLGDAGQFCERPARTR